MGCGAPKQSTNTTSTHIQHSVTYNEPKVWWSLGKSDYLEAFAAHPRIGDAAALRKVKIGTKSI
jgi:hypothetical protein